MSKSDGKQVVVLLVFLGLMAWNASLHIRVSMKNSEDDKSIEKVRPKVSTEPLRSRSKRSAPEPVKSAQNESAHDMHDVGVVYTRWGLDVCPYQDLELVYSGTVGSSRHNETGGSSEYLCLTHDPQYAQYTNALEGTGKIYGVEFEVGRAAILENNGPSGLLQDADVMCAVCRARGKTSTWMIPGRKTCLPGWRREYWGYIFTSHFNHKAQYNFACVDASSTGAERGLRSENGGLMYHVQGVCGSLPCPRYVQGRELTCVVCTK